MVWNTNLGENNMARYKREEDFKTVAEFSDQMSAEITAGMLRANGIEARVFGQASSYPSINYAFDPVAVKVNAQDFEAAKAILEAKPLEDENPSSAEEEKPSED